MARSDFPREAILYRNQLLSHSRAVYKKEDTYVPMFDNFNLPQSIENYLSGNFAHPRPVRPKTLILVGPSRLGKTEWARSLGPHVYIQSQYSVDAFSVKFGYIVWDDIPWDRIPNKKAFLGCQRNPFYLSDKYRGKQQITLSGAPSIILTNDYPGFGPIPADMAWYTANTKIIVINDPLF